MSGIFDRPNPLLQKLGFDNDDRIVILHVDDIGMCNSTITAFEDLDESSSISSGSIMVPCPWFLAAAEFARNHPASDLGVHLTLNSEWPTYRWRPVSTRNIDSGLIDHQGFFHRRYEEAQEMGLPQYVIDELKTQIKNAIDIGIKPTHLDNHMLTLIHPKYLKIYIDLAKEFNLPLALPRLTAEGWQKFRMDAESAKKAEQLVSDLEEDGFPLLDSLTGLKLDIAENRLEQAKTALSSLPAGIHHFYIHPCIDSTEIRAITPDWQGRVADFQAFRENNISNFLRDSGIQTITYRNILEFMPDS